LRNTFHEKQKAQPFPVGLFVCKESDDGLLWREPVFCFIVSPKQAALYRSGLFSLRIRPTIPSVQVNQFMQQV
jgi:hypothetical protein